MRVLIVKTSSMGDVIHTLPAITDAVNVYPNLVFDWVVEDSFAEIPSWHESVDKVIPVAIRRWRKQLHKLLGDPDFKHFKYQVKQNQYDCVIDAQGLIKSSLVTYFVDATTYGYDFQSSREGLASVAYQHRINVSKELHAVERIRHLFAKALGYQLPETIGNYGLQREQFGFRNESKSSLVFIHSTTREDKHWPEIFWLQLCKMVCDAGYIVKLPWGSDVERARAERIAQIDDNVIVLPKLKLREVASIISEAQAVVSVDTGLGHLSAALDVPCIALYGPTSPDKIGTYGRYQIHLCASDYNDVVKDIEPKVFAPLTASIVWDQLQFLFKQNKIVGVV